MRYLYRIQKANERSKRRESLDEEIASERKKSEKRRRQSTNTEHLKRLKKINEDAAYNAGKKKLTSEQVLLQQSRQIIWNGCIPCLFEDAVDPSPWCDERPMNAEEIAAHDPDAVIWYALDYGHIVMHEHLWVFCSVCHLGMRSTNIGKIVPSVISVPNHGTSWHVPPTMKWKFIHHGKCMEQ